jgi:uncharacterized protein (UPF0261 family)
VSAIAVAGGPFHDPAADEALFGSIRAGVDRAVVDLVELDTDVNDPAFATAMADRLDDYLRSDADAADRP